MCLSKMKRTLKTKFFRCLKKCGLPFRQRLKTTIETSSTPHEDYMCMSLTYKDILDYWEDVQRLKAKVYCITEPASSGSDLAQSKEVDCRETFGHQEIYSSETPDTIVENIMVKADEQRRMSKGGCGVEEADVTMVPEVWASLEISLSLVELSCPYWLFTSWMMNVSLSLLMPSCTIIKCSICVAGSRFYLIEEPFQKQVLAVMGEDSSEVPGNLRSLTHGEKDDQSSQLQNSSSGFMAVCVLKDDSLQNACELTSYGRSGLTPPISSGGKAGSKSKKNPEWPGEKPVVVTATGGSSTNQTSKSGQETTTKQSSTSARVTSSSPRSRNAGGTGACGGTGGEEPPDDDRRGKKSPPLDAPGAGDEEQEEEHEPSKEGTVNIPRNVHNKNKFKDFLADSQRFTGYYLRGAGNHVAGDQPATTASPVKSHGRRDGGSFSGLRSRKPENQPNHAPPVAKNACRFTASLPGVVNQDGHRSPSPTVHTRFGDYKDSEMYQRPPESYPTAGSRSPPRFLSGTPVIGESEEHPNTYKEVPPDKPNLTTRDDISSSQPEPLRGEDASALSDTSSQTQPEVPKSQEISEEYRRRNVRDSSGRGSDLSEVDRELYASMREIIWREIFKQDDLGKMEDLVILYHSVPGGNEDHDPGEDDGSLGKD